MNSPTKGGAAPPQETGRREDLRFLTGQGRYVADIAAKNILTAVFLRADVASASLTPPDISALHGFPGVVEAVTARTISDDGVLFLDQPSLPSGCIETPPDVPYALLCVDRIRHIGEPLALVLADTDAAGRDAAELIQYDLTNLDPPRDIVFHRTFGQQSATREGLVAAAHRVSVAVEVPRLYATPMEGRGSLAVPQHDGSLILYTSSQNPFAVRRALLDHFGWPAAYLHVVAPDVGGSFGLKGFMTREDALVCWAARRHGRPVRWLATRSEGFISDHQSRGVSAELTLGLDANLRFTALTANFEVDLGAYPHKRGGGMIANVAGITGVYGIPLAYAEVWGRLSPRAPIAPFRGNGRPEATHAIETLIDAAARSLGVDAVELRRRNMIAPDRLPILTPLGFPLDCGDFPAVFDAVLALNKQTDLAGRKAAAIARGHLHGVGVVTCIESAGGPVVAPRSDHARVDITVDGRVQIAAGVMSVGQGHETAFIRMAALALGLSTDRIDYVNGDTRGLVDGRGSGGSAGLTVAGTAVHLALHQIIVEGRRVTAARFMCDAEAVTFDNGTFTVIGTNQSLSLAEIAQAKVPWRVDAEFLPVGATFPNGAHICEVEIDPETGETKITRYSAVEDVGHVLNPDLVAGQLHGGIAMGLSQVLGERVEYDETSQILTGTMMDYYVVRAGDLPMVRLDIFSVPTALNPLGVKGVGEAGTVGAMAALMSAVRDALDTTDFDMPATPCRVWQALQRRSVR